VKTSALFVIESDPRLSGRPAEAVRIAAGVGVWKKVDVAVYLRNAAVLILGEDADSFVDGENYTRYLPILCDLSQQIYVHKAAPLPPSCAQKTTAIEEISDDQLAQMAAAHGCVLRF
jgi:hypothetical protein